MFIIICASCIDINQSILNLQINQSTNRYNTFGIMPQYTAVRPLYRLIKPSRSMMRRAVPIGPREAVTTVPCRGTADVLECPIPKGISG